MSKLWLILVAVILLGVLAWALKDYVPSDGPYGAENYVIHASVTGIDDPFVRFYINEMTKDGEEVPEIGIRERFVMVDENTKFLKIALEIETTVVEDGEETVVYALPQEPLAPDENGFVLAGFTDLNRFSGILIHTEQDPFSNEIMMAKEIHIITPY